MAIAESTRKEKGTFRYRFETADYDEAGMTLLVDGLPVSLEPRPLRLLGELLRHVNEVVTKDELFETVWDGRPTVDNVLASAVTKLRKALGEAAAARIVNVPRIGYRFEGPVERIVTGNAPLLVPSLRAGQPVPGCESYVLQSLLGAPERGNVWLARHGKIKTQLHVFKFANDADQLRQLKREYTLYRVLQTELGERQDFARLLDSNFSQAPYFLECEYGGADLLNWSKGPETPLTTLPQRERLNLFLQIARAVAAAHGVGVLHKDLKPSNILISGGPDHWVIKLTDFGSGRAMDPDRLRALGLTAMGMTLTQSASGESFSGTAQYLAPEVLAGKAPSMQSDLYALGVMLFQLLVGDLRRPMTTGWERDISDELLRSDIAAATEGALENRLGGVAMLIERLTQLECRAQEQHQRELALQGLHQAESDRQRRRARRPWLISAGLSLGVGLLVAVALYWRADAARAVATAEAARAASINAFITKDILQSPDFSRGSKGRVLTAADLLSRASARVGERFKDQPRTEASIRRALGEADTKLVSMSSAATEYRRAIALLEPMVPADDSELLASQFGLARALSASYQAKEGEKLLLTAEQHLRSRQEAPSAELSLDGKRARLAVMMALQQNKEALPVAVELIGMVDRLRGSDISERFAARQVLAELYIRLNDLPQANALLSQLMQPPYSAEDVGAVTYALGRISTAKALLAADKFKEGKTLLLTAREELLNAQGPDSFLMGLVNVELSSASNSLGEEAETTQYLRDAYAAFAASLGEQHNYTRSIATNLAFGEISNGDAAAGLKALDALSGWIKTVTGSTDAIDQPRAIALNKLGRHEEALRMLDGINMENFLFANEEIKGQKWTIQAERGIALIGLHRTAEGRRLLSDAIASMHRDGTPAAMFPRYDKALSGGVGRRS